MQRIQLQALFKDKYFCGCCWFLVYLTVLSVDNIMWLWIVGWSVNKCRDEKGSCCDLILCLYWAWSNKERFWKTLSQYCMWSQGQDWRPEAATCVEGVIVGPCWFPFNNIGLVQIGKLLYSLWRDRWNVSVAIKMRFKTKQIKCCVRWQKLEQLRHYRHIKRPKKTSYAFTSCYLHLYFQFICQKV
jgi:hypothetical protein